MLAQARAACAPDSFLAAWAGGRELPLEQAIAAARAVDRAVDMV
ncbi:MAG TPA: hypothetical protein VFU22_26775 [Roseiflexaceae bacterium]|nr:hypothetical protein [Roseiflexaceae bacterium]